MLTISRDWIKVALTFPSVMISSMNPQCSLVRSTGPSFAAIPAHQTRGALAIPNPRYLSPPLSVIYSAVFPSGDLDFMKRAKLCYSLPRYGHD